MMDISIEIIPPEVQRIEVAVKMSKNRIPIEKITVKINAMIDEQNENRKTLGIEPVNNVGCNDVRKALAWARKNGYFETKKM